MSFVKLANELLIYRERIYDSRAINPHGWPEIDPRKFDWTTDQAGIYHTGVGSPLMPDIITPRGVVNKIRLNCDTTEKLYDKQEVTEFEDCTTAKEHTIKWNSSPAVKKSIESYKMTDAWSFLKALALAFGLARNDESMKTKDWLAYTQFIPYLSGINRVDFFRNLPQIESSMPLKTIANFSADNAITYLEVKK